MPLGLERSWLERMVGAREGFVSVREIAGRVEARPVIAVLGVPLALGCGLPGVELGPGAMRTARLKQRVASLGYRVEDLGNLAVPEAEAENESRGSDNNLKNLKEIVQVCVELAECVERLMGTGRLPVILGGDHAIAIGSLSGVSSYYKERGESWGLLWFDAHADMNTPEISPSGNIHGMPLAALCGYGAPALTEVQGFSPKLEPGFCVHLGARDVDVKERAVVRESGIRFITMREIDERGMSACLDEALEIVGRAPGGFAVTFDIDVLDPGDAPGSGTLVRGGLTYREAHLAMERVAETGGLRSLEVVEINTALDVNNRTADLGVELILSALGKTIL